MSHLSKEKPNALEVSKLDRFDQAFLIMTGNVKMITPAEALVNALKVSGDVVLWGPESVALARILNQAWVNNGGTEFTTELVAAFDLTGEISVDSDEVDRIFEQYEDIWQAMWIEASVQAIAIIERALRRSRRHFQKIKQQNFDEFMEAYLLSASERIEAGLDWYIAEELRGEVTRLVGQASTKESLRTIDRVHLRDRIQRLVRHPQNHFRQFSDIEAGRAWHGSGIQYFTERGFQSYQVIAERDRVTCPVCKQIDGKVYSVPLAMRKYDRFMTLAGNFAQARDVFDFPRVSELDNLSPEDWQKRVDLPPFHPRCRCDVVAL